MEVLKVQKGQIVAKKNDKVKEWYFIQEGSVIQKYAFVELELKQNGIVGILENDRFLYDYIAAEDSALAVFPCESTCYFLIYSRFPISLIITSQMQFAASCLLIHNFRTYPWRTHIKFFLNYYIVFCDVCRYFFYISCALLCYFTQLSVLLCILNISYS